MSLNNWFEQGLTKDQYMEDLADLKDGFHTIYNTFEVPKGDQSLLPEYKNLRVIVLAEVWCGHCMLNIPILLKLAEAAEIDIRFLPRDSHLELMDQYLTDNKRYIPIFVFIDEAGNELGTWGPMSPEVKAYTDELKKDLPDKDSPEYESKFRTMIEKTSKRFTEDKDLWNHIYDNLKNTINEITAK